MVNRNQDLGFTAAWLWLGPDWSACSWFSATADSCSGTPALMWTYECVRLSDVCIRSALSGVLRGSHLCCMDGWWSGKFVVDWIVILAQLPSVQRTILLSLISLNTFVHTETHSQLWAKLLASTVWILWHPNLFYLSPLSGQISSLLSWFFWGQMTWKLLTVFV